jgi:nitroreductase
MTLTEAIYARRSIRKYKSGTVSQEQLDALLEAAMLAPSAGNSRQWEFVVVRNREKLDAIMHLHPFAQMLKSASLAIVVCGVPNPKNPILAGFFPQDCAAAAENILLRAVDLGLGACWCGVYSADDWGQKLCDAFRDTFGIESIPFNIIALGIPDEAPAQRGFYDKTKVRYLD